MHFIRLINIRWAYKMVVSLINLILDKNFKWLQDSLVTLSVDFVRRWISYNWQDKENMCEMFIRILFY